MHMPKREAARIFRDTARNLTFLGRQLRNGRLVAAPTETVYGLAANAFDAQACAQIFSAKGRPPTDPLIVHLLSVKDLSSVCQPNETAWLLARAFWPGPLTLVLPKTSAVPDIVTAGGSSVAVRVPSHRLFRRLLKAANVPLAAPSANPFGYVSPTTAKHVADGLGQKISFILDGGPTPIGLESTIIDLRKEQLPTLLRPGAVTREQIERILGRPIAILKRSSQTPVTEAQAAPGMLERHYSPKTPISLYRKLIVRNKPDEAFVFFRRPERKHGANIFWLDENGDLKAAGRRLFAILRELDKREFIHINIELAPGTGLADAINDRLRRAAAR